MREQLSMEMFEELKRQYKKENDEGKYSMIFHLSPPNSSGVYSELGSMIRCFIFCHMNDIKFIMYSDDANITGGHGFEEFWLPFCEENHEKLNMKYNYKDKKYGIKKTFPVQILKKITNVDFLTQDFFKIFAYGRFREKPVEWDLFGMSGLVDVEMGKVMDFCMRYNDQTWEEICNLVSSVGLPDEYLSIQMRGGDKIIECELLTTEEYVNHIIGRNTGVKDIFVFTDEYRYVEELKEQLPDYNIYTLCEKNENGFVIDEFREQSWNIKRKNMIKLFAMMEICYEAKVHFGFNGANSSGIIQSIRIIRDKEYYGIDPKIKVDFR